ncbi:MAG: TatD family hydrolase [Aeromonas sp.]
MIDIAVNLTSPQLLPYADAVVQRAQAAGVRGLLLLGTDIASSQASATLAARWPGVCFSTAGVHPHDASQFTVASLDALRALASQAPVVALGEMGLDFNRDFSPRPQQEAAFSAQLALAVELGLPVLLHCREAHARFVALLAPWLPKLRGAVLHCFTGSDAELDECLALGLHIGVTGWLCDERRGEDLRRQVARIPAGRLLLETDAPYLVPRDLRPRPKCNEPALLPHIAQVIADLRAEPLSVLLAHTRATTHRLFNLPLQE